MAYLASRVQPPLEPMELTRFFIHTLKAPYFSLLVGHASKDFSELVLSGDAIDEAIKDGRLKTSETGGYKASATQKKKDSESPTTANITATPTYKPRPQYTSPYHAPRSQLQPTYLPYASPPQNTYTFYPTSPRPRYRPNTYPHSPYAQQAQASGVVASTNVYPRPNTSVTINPKPRLDPLPMSYTELFPQLVAAKLITPFQPEPLKPSFPYWYNPDARCEYHEVLSP